MDVQQRGTDSSSGTSWSSESQPDRDLNWRREADSTLKRNGWEVIERTARRGKETVVRGCIVRVGEPKTRELRFGRGREGSIIAFRSSCIGTLREYDPKARAMGRDWQRERNGVRSFASTEESRGFE